MKRPRLLLTVLAGLALAGFAATIAVAPAARAGPNCDIDASIDSEEQQFLELINDYRQDNGAGPLALSPALNRAAAWKSQHMVDANYFAHDDVPINRTWDDRIHDCGYNYPTWIGENIAAGNESAEDTFEQWRNSSGHNQNMLNSNYNAIGIGRAFGPNATYGWYWTTDFGGVVDGPPPPPTNTSAPTSTNTPTNTPSNPPTNTPTRTPTNTPTRTPTNTPTNTPAPPPIGTPPGTPEDSPPTNTPTRTPRPPTPTRTPTPQVSEPSAPTATSVLPTSTPTRPLPPPAPPDPDGDVSCDNDTGSLDAALVLQLDAHVIAGLPCRDAGDVNGDGAVDAIDALVILQYAAGLIASLPI